jgi:hypothetical protein
MKVSVFINNSFNFISHRYGYALFHYKNRKQLWVWQDANSVV